MAQSINDVILKNNEPLSIQLIANISKEILLAI
jgi:hypothetical protein